VHYSSDYDGVGDAVAAWDELSANHSLDPHTLGVVAFLFQEVDVVEDGGRGVVSDVEAADRYNAVADAVLLEFAENEEMTEVWSNASGSALLSFAITELVDVPDFEHNYYHYWGSLTTPPCTPAVSWHLAQNTVKVRKSTMDRFRAKTALWVVPADATSNFRPIQSNPSCVSKCAGDEAAEYCPGGLPLGDDELNAGRLMPLWITIAAVLSILVAVCVINANLKSECRRWWRRKGTPKRSRPPKTEMTKVPTADISETIKVPDPDDAAEAVIVYDSGTAEDCTL